MATVVAYTTAFDMSEGNLASIDDIGGNSEIITATYTGASYRYDNGYTSSIAWDQESRTLYIHSVAYYDGAGTPVMALGHLDVRLSVYASSWAVSSALSVSNMLRGNDTIIGAGFDDYIVAYSGDDTIYSGPGNDLVRAETGNDVIAAQEGDDIILPGSGNDFVDGWTGLDTVVVTGSSSTYSVTRAGGAVTLQKSGETDTLINVERVQFDNGTMVVSQSDPAFTVHRLYGAAFGREPEGAGLQGWTQQLQGGLADREMAAYLAASQEFAMRYGNPGNAEFVRLCYANVLGRDPSASESQGWVQGLDGGSLSRSDVLLGFANSAENVAATTARTGDALWLG